MNLKDKIRDIRLNILMMVIKVNMLDILFRR